VITWIIASPQRIQTFKLLSKGLMPRRDNGTRWNSWYEMLERAIHQLKTPLIQTITENKGLNKDSLTSSDWRTLTKIRDFLQGFYDTTKATEGRKATLDKVLPSLDFMVIKFEQAIKTYADDLFMSKYLQAGWSKILKY